MNYVSTIGFFDGLHLGHQYLLQQLKSESAQRGMATKVFTFSQHPRKVLQPSFCPHLLTTLEEKRELIEALGIDECRVLDFDRTMADMTAAEFMREVLVPESVKVLLMGYDHRFGSDRADFHACLLTGRDFGIEVVEESPWSNSGVVVSSSLVRNMLEKGLVREVAGVLGRNYTLSGVVVEGRRVGHSLGFPTANLRPDSPDKIIPACGAYAVRCIVEASAYDGMTNIGTRPTLQNGQDVSIETHLFDYSADLYGQTIRLEFVERLREEMPFTSLEALKQQLAADAARTKTILSNQ